MVTLGVGMAGSGQKTGQLMPRLGHSGHRRGVRLQNGTLSAISLEWRPRSRWNTVRHQLGIVSALGWNTHSSKGKSGLQVSTRTALIHGTLGL